MMDSNKPIDPQGRFTSSDKKTDKRVDVDLANDLYNVYVAT